MLSALAIIPVSLLLPSAVDAQSVAASPASSNQLRPQLPEIRIDPAALRADATDYPAPEYPASSLRANHSGRVVVEVTVAPASRISPLARVVSSKVVEAADSDLAAATLDAIKQARYMPYFDDNGKVEQAVSRIVWEFRITDDKPEVIDPYAPPIAAKSPAGIAADDLKIVRRARELLGSESLWFRADNRQCPPNRKAVSLYCALVIATRQVTGTFEHRGTVMEDARDAIDQYAPQHPDYDHLLMGYNNDPKTTFTDIQKVLDLTEAAISKRHSP